MVGREGIEPPVSEDGWSTASCAPWRDRPMTGPGGAGPDDDASAVVKELVSRLVAGRVEAGSEGVEPSAIGFGSRGTAVARAQGVARMTLCAWCGEELEFGEFALQEGALGAPVAQGRHSHDGRARRHWLHGIGPHRRRSRTASLCMDNCHEPIVRCLQITCKWRISRSTRSHA